MTPHTSLVAGSGIFGLIADIVEGQPNPYPHKFRRRPEVRLPRSQEEARFQSSERK